MIYNIPQSSWFRVQDSTLDVVYAGYFDTNDESKILSFMKLGFLKHDCLGTFKVKLHTSLNFTRVYAESEVISFADVKERYFTGQIKFNFKDVNLLKNTRYYVTIHAVTYTRNADDSYIGWLHDRDFTTNISTGNWPNEFPLRMEMFVK